MILREVLIYMICKYVGKLTNLERKYIIDWATVEYSIDK